MWVLVPWPGIKSSLPWAFGAHRVFTTGPPEKSLVESILFVSTPYSTQSRYGSDAHTHRVYHNIQFSSVAQLCPTLCDLMNCSTSGLPVHHQLLEFTQTHVGDAIQPSHPLSSPSPPDPNPPSIRVFSNESTLHEVAKVLEFQLQHQSFQRTPRTDLL